MEVKLNLGYTQEYYQLLLIDIRKSKWLLLIFWQSTESQ